MRLKFDLPLPLPCRLRWVLSFVPALRLPGEPWFDAETSLNCLQVRLGRQSVFLEGMPRRR